MDHINATEEKPDVSNVQLLWKIVYSVEKIESVLIGNAYTNNKGLVHKVEAQGVQLDDIDSRVRDLEMTATQEDKSEKKVHSLWSIAASWLAAAVALAALIFATKTK